MAKRKHRRAKKKSGRRFTGFVAKAKKRFGGRRRKGGGKFNFARGFVSQEALGVVAGVATTGVATGLVADLLKVKSDWGLLAVRTGLMIGGTIAARKFVGPGLGNGFAIGSAIAIGSNLAAVFKAKSGVQGLQGFELGDAFDDGSGYLSIPGAGYGDHMMLVGEDDYAGGVGEYEIGEYEIGQVDDTAYRQIGSL